MDEILCKQLTNLLHCELNQGITSSILTVISRYSADFGCVIYYSIMKDIYTQIIDQKTTEQQTIFLFSIANDTISVFYEQNFFFDITIRVFNEQDIFLKRLFSSISMDNAAILLICAAFSKFSTQAIEILKTKQINRSINIRYPKLSDYWYEKLNELGFESKNQQILDEISTIYLDLNNAINVSLLDIVSEYRYDSVIKLQTLLDICHIYDNFNFGKYLIALSYNKEFCINAQSIPQNNIKNIFREIFDYLKSETNMQTIYEQLDDPELVRLNTSGFNTLTLLLVNLNSNIFDTTFLVKQWKNMDSQFAFLKYIAKSENPIFKFENNNFCWKSSSFITRIIEYSRKNIQSIKELFHECGKNYSAIILFSLMKTNFIDPTYITVLLSYFYEQNQDMSIIEEMWEFNPQIMKKFSFLYSNSLSSNVRLILDKTPKDKIPILLIQNDMNYSIHLASIAIWNYHISPALYMKIIVENELLIDFLDQFEISKNQFHENSIILMFEYLQNNFSNFSKPLRTKIVTKYNQICQINPNIAKLDFTYKTQKVSDSMRKSAEDILNPYMRSEANLQSVIEKVKKSEKDDKTFFEYFMFLVTNELKYLDKHSSDEHDLIVDLIIDLLRMKLIPQNFLQTIFEFIENSLEKNTNFAFACKFVQSFMKCMDSHCFFASKLLQINNFYKNNKELYQKVSKKLNSFAFQEFIETLDDIPISEKVLMFMNVKTPSVKISRSIQQLIDSNSIQTAIEKHNQHLNFLAISIVNFIGEQPSKIEILTNALLQTNLVKPVCYAIGAYIYSTIRDPKFDKYISAHIKLSNIGKFLGSLTLKQTKCFTSDIVNLKDILYYSLSLGKLYGVVPFVCSVLQQASFFFYPPNPFTSGIIQIMASIAVIPGIKGSIKFRIESLLQHFRVSLDDVGQFLDIFPDKVDDNFDFVRKPISLQKLFTQAQIDRICSFDENLCFSLIEGNIKIRESSKMKENIDSAKSKLVFAIFNLIKLEASKIADLITNTAITQINIDMNTVKSRSKLLSSAYYLTGLLSSSLISQEVFFLFKRSFQEQLMQIFEEDYDAQWAQFICEANNEWCTSLIKEISHNKAFHSCRQVCKLDEIEEKTSFIDYTLDADIRLCNNIYIEKQEMPDIDIDEEINNYINLILSETQYELTRHRSTLFDIDQHSILMNLLWNYPIIEEIPEERLIRIIRTFFGYFASSFSQLSNEVLVCAFSRILHKINPSNNVSKISLLFLKNVILPPEALAMMIRYNIFNINDLDEIFTEVLNRPNQDPQFAAMIANFVNLYICETNEFDPLMLVHSIFLIASYPKSEEFSVNQKNIKNLLNRITLMSSRESANAAQTKEVDPIKEIANNNDFSSLFTKWENSLSTQNESQIQKTVKACLRMPRDFFVVAISKGKEISFQKFMICALHFNDFSSIQEPLLSALSSLARSTKYSLSLSFKHIFSEVLKISSKESSTLAAAVSTLHDLRPLLVPSFTYVWFDLVSNPYFVVSLAVAHYSWPLLQLLLSDMCCSVILAQSLYQPPIFQVLYKALLRFVLVLLHDFPDFIVGSASVLCHIIPTQFYELRNLILSAAPSGVIFIPPAASDFRIDKLPDVHQISYPVNPAVLFIDKNISAAIERIIERTSEEQIYEIDANDAAMIRDYIIENNRSIPKIIDACFEMTFSPRQGSAPRIPFKQLPIFNLIMFLIVANKSSISQIIIDCLIDLLRYPSRNSHFFAKLLVEIFSISAITQDGYFVKEIIASVAMRRAPYEPRPWGLQVLLFELLSNRELGLWDLPSVQSSEKSRMFLRSILASLIET